MRLNLHGIVNVESATQIVEEEYEEPVKVRSKCEHQSAGWSDIQFEQTMQRELRWVTKYAVKDVLSMICSTNTTVSSTSEATDELVVVAGCQERGCQGRDCRHSYAGALSCLAYLL